MTSTWDHIGIAQHARLAEQVTLYNPLATQYLTQLESTGLSEPQALAQLDRTLNTQAYLLSANWVLYTSGLIMVSLVALIWWARPPFGVRSDGPNKG